MRVHLAADELVGREDRLDALHHRVAVEVEVGDHPLVAERAQHDAFGAGHVERFEADFGDAGEQGFGIGGGGFRA